MRYKQPDISLLDCGDVSDVVHSGMTLQPDSDCSFICTGDATHLCGGAFRIQYYVWTGSAHVWHMPEITGRYEVRKSLDLLAVYESVTFPSPVLRYVYNFPSHFLIFTVLSF